MVINVQVEIVTCLTSVEICTACSALAIRYFDIHGAQYHDTILKSVYQYIAIMICMCYLSNIFPIPITVVWRFGDNVVKYMQSL